MEILRALFLLVYFSGAAFFFFKKKHDIFSVAYWSCMFYFVPGVFGFTGIMNGGVWSESPIEGEVYLIYTMVMASLMTTAYLRERLGWTGCGNLPEAKSAKGDEVSDARERQLFLVALLIILACGGVMTAILSNNVLWFASSEWDKGDTLRVLDHRWYVICANAAAIGFVYSAITRRWQYLVIFSLFLVLDLWLGYRNNVVAALVAFSFIFLGSNDTWIKWRFSFVGFVAVTVCALLIYKGVLYQVRTGNLEMAAFFLSQPDFYADSVYASEPFAVQENLNRAVIAGFTTDGSDVYSGIYAGIVFAPELGFEVVSYNQLFQPVLFGDISWGQANNIWAQMWSWNRWWSLAPFIVLFLVVVHLSDCLVRKMPSRNLFWSAVLSVVVFHVVFFIHRNDLVYMMVSLKRPLIVALFAFLFILLCRSVPSGHVRKTGIIK
jgi:hypothetical protein